MTNTARRIRRVWQTRRTVDGERAVTEQCCGVQYGAARRRAAALCWPSRRGWQLAAQSFNQQRRESSGVTCHVSRVVCRACHVSGVTGRYYRVTVTGGARYGRVSCEESIPVQAAPRSNKWTRARAVVAFRPGFFSGAALASSVGVESGEPGVALTSGPRQSELTTHALASSPPRTG